MAEPEPEYPTDEELEEEFGRALLKLPGDSMNATAVAFARAVLARWGNHPGSPDSSTLQPVPVSERLPGPGDCTTNPRTGEGQWCWGWVQHDPIPYSGRWRMIRREWLVDEAKAWLPAHALPLPS